MFNLILILIFFTSCSSTQDIEVAPYQPGEKQERSFGLDFDSLSLSSMNKRALQKRSSSLKEVETSLEIMAELLVVQILSGRPDLESSELIKEIAEKATIKDSSKGMEDSLAYEMMLFFLRKKDYHKVYYLLSRLFSSESDIFKAKAYNIKGVLESRASRIPEAILNFQESYRLNKSDEAVALNLGLLHLQHGFWDEAQKYLEPLSSHPMATFMLALADQMRNNQPLSLDLCRSYIERYPGNKLFLFNCGQAAFEIHHDKKLAKPWLQASLKIHKQYRFIDRSAQKMLESISRK